MCTEKIKNKPKETVCGPIYSMYYMLSNLLEFDIEIKTTTNLQIWNIELDAKVTNILKLNTIKTSAS